MTDERTRRPFPPRQFGPKLAEHTGVGETCRACDHPIGIGDYTTLVALGPGADPEAQARAAAGLPHNAVAIEVHWTCATGLPPTVDGPAHLGAGDSVVEP